MNEDKAQGNRINLVLPLETSIKIERESDKRGINRTQYIKEAIHEKLQKESEHEIRISEELNTIRREIEGIIKSNTDLRDLLMIIAKK